MADVICSEISAAGFASSANPSLGLSAQSSQTSLHSARPQFNTLMNLLSEASGPGPVAVGNLPANASVSSQNEPNSAPASLNLFMNLLFDAPVVGPVPIVNRLDGVPVQVSQTPPLPGATQTDPSVQAVESRDAGARNGSALRLLLNGDFSKNGLGVLKKDDPKLGKNGKDKDSPSGLPISLPLKPVDLKPPLQILRDPSAEVGSSRTPAVAEPEVSTVEVNAATAARPEPAISEAPVPSPARDPSPTGHLAFAAQLTDFKAAEIGPNTSSATPEIAAARAQLQTTADRGTNSSGASPISSATAANEDTAPDGKQSPRETDKDGKVILSDDAANSLTVPKPDPGTSMTDTSSGAAPAKSAPPPTPAPSRAGSSDTNVESKSDVTSASHPPQTKEISLRVPGADSTIDLKLTDNAGKIQVSVRSTDPELARSIQSNLGDLVGQLEKKGFETETWVPAEHGAAAAANEPSNEHTGSGNSQKHAGSGGQQPGEGRQQGQGQGQRPKWLDELELGFTLDTSSGANSK